MIRRVVLDYEPKKNVYSPLAKARALPPLEFAKCQVEVPRSKGPKVVGGKIPLPDLRIEYETAEGDLAKVDLELETDTITVRMPPRKQGRLQDICRQRVCIQAKRRI